MAKQTQSRHWCFTSYVDGGDRDVWEYRANLMVGSEQLNYLVCQGEICPETEREHVQGYLQVPKKCGMRKIKEILDDNSVHLEVRRGTHDEARGYCVKEDSRNWDVIEIGIADTAGKRHDLERTWKYIREHGVAAALERDEYVGCTLRHLRALTSARAFTAHRNFVNMNVIVLHGPSGCGKTRTAFELADRIEPDKVPYVLFSHAPTWFDGYDGQKVLIVDEADKELIPIRTMLRLLDGYPMMCPIKGGSVPKCFDTVILTANKPWERWYPGLSLDEEDGLRRRISEARDLA